MGMKIKANDDRIAAVAVAVLLISRARLARGEAGGLVAEALARYRGDPEAYKAEFAKRDLAAARLTEELTHEGRRALYLRLLAAVEALLAKIARNRTQFSSVAELDNYFAFNLKSFD
ncbi:MAG: hypothetical protein NTU80_13535 [Verrucomicrobia bacterium]|nr:hypothetical protein [Verrucomicrobiota bacterium]